MKTRYIKYFAGFVFLLIGVVGCQKFDEFNQNPNAPEEVDPQFLLSNVLVEASDNQAYWGWHAGSLLAQHSANLEFLPVDRYDLGNNEGLWNETYRLLNDLQAIMRSDQGNEAYTAICQILTAHQAALLTDLWANVPFSEALQGESNGNFTPIFDAQEAIYTSENGILDLLRRAVVTLESTSASVNGDVMYNGDLNAWIRFANALRVRYLLRISNKMDVSTELQSIVDEGQIFTSNAESALIPYLSSAPNQWVIFNEREGRYVDVRMSKTAENIFTALDDPRVGVFYKPTVNSMDGSPEYTGIPNGLSRESQNDYDLNDVSLMGSFLRDEPDGMDAVFMTYSELQFCLAEASLKGMISGLPAAYYEAGIQASFDHYEVELPAGYFLSAEVLLDGTEDLKKIMTQKWIALFMNGYESWLDIRRTGLPEMMISPDNLNGNVYPVRYRYPSSEQAVNSANYANAVTAIGGDNYNSKGWWEE